MKTSSQEISEQQHLLSIVGTSMWNDRGNRGPTEWNDIVKISDTVNSPSDLTNMETKTLWPEDGLFKFQLAVTSLAYYLHSWRKFTSIAIIFISKVTFIVIIVISDFLYLLFT